MPPSKMCPAVWSLANTCSLSLGDIHVVSKPGRVGRIHDLLAAALWRHSGIQIHHVKDAGGTAQGSSQTCAKGWNGLLRLCVRKQMWRGSCCPQTVKVSKCSGHRLGHPHYVARHLQGIVEEHQTPLDHIPHVKDLQSASLLLLHCASARASHQLRTVDPASRRRNSRKRMMRASGSVCATSCKSTPHKHRQ